MTTLNPEGDASHETKKTIAWVNEQIEERFGRELDRWKERRQEVRYSLPILDFLICGIGEQIESLEAGGELEKDAEFYNPSWYVSGVTNGELCYSLFKTIGRMTEDKAFNLTEDLLLCDMEIFVS